jgi:carbamoyltransferase
MMEMTNAYWGPGFSREDIKALLDESKLSYSEPQNITEKAAELIAGGNIIGWFQGRMEIGPRALGNRSILANPMIKGMDERVNREIKHREVWRPFAPSLIEEAASKYFEGVEKISASPFMLHTFYVREEFRELLPAITHVDGSSRIQTVRKDQNARYYELLTELGKRTGHPIVLNTSFNDNGEPIVCTPKDALKCFSATGLDALVLGDFLVIKNQMAQV